MPTDATSLRRGAGSTRAVNPLTLPPMPEVRLPAKLRDIVGDAEASRYEAELSKAIQQRFDRILETVESLRQQLRT